MSQPKQYGGIYAFLLRVLLWLPLCFVVWYYLAPALLLPVVALTEFALTNLLPQAISGLDPVGNQIEVITAFSPKDQPGGLLAFEINPLLYSYSLPLLSGLILAVPEAMNEKWSKIAIGLLLLVPVQAWGLSFEILKFMVLQMPAEFSDQIFTSQTAREGVAMGYQFGYLIMPAVAPLVIWVALYNRFVTTLVPSIGSRKA